MTPRHSRRLRALVRHTAQPAGSPRLLAHGVRPAPDSAGSGPEPPPPHPRRHPLSEAQKLAWARDGFLAFAVDDLPAEQLREAYDHACRVQPDPDRPGALRRRGNFELDGPLSPLLDRMLSSPRTRGALASLLGEDFVANGAWSGGPGYTGDTFDQQWHKVCVRVSPCPCVRVKLFVVCKDDTHVPVRDHHTRYLNLFFMPGAVDDTMGPTELLAVRRRHAHPCIPWARALPCP